jgi:hypothetical protein
MDQDHICNISLFKSLFRGREDKIDLQFANCESYMGTFLFGLHGPLILFHSRYNSSNSSLWVRHITLISWN